MDVSYAPHADIDKTGEALGPEIALLPFGELGPTLCARAKSFLVSTSVDRQLGVIAIGTKGRGTPMGIFAAFRADRLRRIAAQLLAAADHLDGGAGVQ